MDISWISLPFFFPLEVNTTTNVLFILLVQVFILLLHILYTYILNGIVLQIFKSYKMVLHCVYLISTSVFHTILYFLYLPILVDILPVHINCCMLFPGINITQFFSC